MHVCIIIIIINYIKRVTEYECLLFSDSQQTSWLHAVHTYDLEITS